MDIEQPDEILPFLYIGSINTVNRQNLCDIGIKNIIICGSDCLTTNHDSFNYILLNIFDETNVNISKYFETTNCFIEQARNSGSKILVHCFAGKSRSSSIVMAYLIMKQHMTFDEAYNLIKFKRPIVKPNCGFIKQLKML